MGLLIDIKKTHESRLEVFYAFSTSLGNAGEVSINKQTGEFYIISEPDKDVDSKLAIRVGVKLMQHWRNGQLPEQTCWAS
jgi:hypothetical protein